jgi:hypothetical protein
MTRIGSTGHFRRTHGRGVACDADGGDVGFAGVAVAIPRVLTTAPQAVP